MPETLLRFLRRTWVRRAIPAGAVALLVVGGTALVRTTASASPIDTYRTTTVTTGSVEQRLDLTGSVHRVNQVSQSFAVPGTVSGVSVTVGDNVTAGQALATLDARPLTSAVTSAEASLAQAKATLESDQTATTTVPSAATVTPAQTATPTTSPQVASPSVRPVASANQSLAAAQDRVTRSQNAIDADLGQATAALARCAPFFPSEQLPSAPTGTAPAGGATTAPTSAAATTTTSTPSGAEITACLGALRTAPTQQQIQRDQQTVTSSQADLTKAFTLVITTAGNTATAAATTNRSGSSSQSGSSQSSTSRSSGGQTGGTSQSAADRVVSDKAAVTNAEASLTSAEADQSSATLRSSMAGTVGSVSLVNGTSSGGKNITIVGAGAAQVTINVPLASMAGVHVGQKANVTPQGATGSVPGSVTSISLLPFTAATGTGPGTGAAQSTTTAASSPTYPVVVLVPDALPSLAPGARAEVSLLIGTVSNVLTVPNSALTPMTGGQALAMTLRGGVATRALVKTGYAGTLTTQITSGLTAGQQVVLANLSTALPTNTTNARRFGVSGGAAGGFGGVGLGGGGLGGGTITGRTGFTPRG